ncbi:MAG TPA: penicillin-binding protein 1B [Porticoccaceae bacterium]|nr:penicillin-binding protein 1B [Porticoccaceae bacterium]
MPSKKKPKTKKNQRRRARPGRLRRLARWLILLVLLVGAGGVLILDFIVREKFSGAKWSLPSHVYSRPLELYEGLNLSRDQLLWELSKLGYRQVDSVNGPGQFWLQGQRLNIRSRVFEFWDGEQPEQNIQLRFDSRGIRSIRDGAGKALALARLEPLLIGGIYPEHLEDREPVLLEDLPPYLIDSLLAVEDRNFYHHRGVSLRGIARALLGNLRQGKMSQGGSTITQQLVKNFYLTRERTLVRKGLEAVMTVLLELHYSKAEILETYINEIYLGQAGKRAIHGFGMASRHYFRQPLRELDVHQVALLTGLLKGASYYDPRRHPERALARRNLVIDELANLEMLDGDSARRAKGRGLDISSKPGTSMNLFPGYLDLTQRQLRRDYPEKALRSEGLRVFTSFDPQLQRRVQATLAKQLTELERQWRLENNSLQAAAVVVRVGTGEVVALAGSRKGGVAGFNRALDARRSVGSTIKPAVYLTALGRGFTLSSLVDDSSFSLALADGSHWQPKNFDRLEHGQVPAYEALARSYNQATARLAAQLGVAAVAKTVRELGYDGDLPQVPALALGGVSMSPLDVASLYHTIASDGYYSPLSAIESVYTSDNQPLKRYPRQSEARFEPGVMHLLQYAMQAVVREGTGKGAYATIGPEVALAGKTGTSNDQRDSWFAGFGGNYLAVVWVGRDDNGMMPLTGSTGALKVWAQIMARIGVSSLNFVQPENVEYHWVETRTGLLSGADCEGARKLPFIKGSEPVDFARCSERDRGGNIADWLRGVLGW